MGTCKNLLSKLHLKLNLKNKYNIIIAGIVAIFPFMGKIAGFGDLSLIVPTLICCVLLSVVITSRKRALRISLTDVILVIFGVYVITRDISSDSITAGRCMQYLLTTSAYMLVRLYCDRAKKAVLMGILLCGVVQSTIAYLQIAGVQNSNHSAFACTGSFSNPALLGCIVAVSLAVAVSELKLKSNAVCWVLVVCIAYMLPVLILSDSRASWVAFGIGVTIILLREWRLKRFWKMIVVGVVAMMVAIPLYNHKPLSADARVLIWKVCGNISKENTLTGAGTDAVRREYMHYQADYFQNGGTEKERIITANNNYAFNELLDILCSYGVIGVILFLGIVITYFACNGIGCTPSVGVMCILVFGMFSYPFSNIVTLTIFTLLLAMEKGKTVLYLRHKCAKYITVIIVVALLSVAGVKWWEFKRFDDALKEYCWEISEKEYVKSNFHNIKNEPMLVSRYGRLLYETGNYAEAIPILDRMRELQASPEVYYDLGKCYEKTAEYDNAERCYKMVSYMLPAYITPQYKLLKLYKLSNQDVKAIETAQYMLGMPLKKETSESERMKIEAMRVIKAYGV